MILYENGEGPEEPENDNVTYRGEEDGESEDYGERREKAQRMMEKSESEETETDNEADCGKEGNESEEDHPIEEDPTRTSYIGKMMKVYCQRSVMCFLQCDWNQ